MGLDIYVYRTKDFAKYREMKELIQQADDESSKVWEELSGKRRYEEISENERNEILIKTETSFLRNL